MTDSIKDLSYYLGLPYPVEVLQSKDRRYVAHHPDLPGCMAHGDGVPATLQLLAEARRLWLESKLDAGEAPPTPAAEPSGRLMLRVPIRLHAQLSGLAEEYGKSLNGLLNELLFNITNALPPDHELKVEPKAHDTKPDAPAEPAEPRYAYWITPSPPDGFVAEHPDLPGCMSQGATAIEAMQGLDEACAVWIKGRESEGLPVPDPLSAAHTGVIHLRMPPALHADLARDARRNGATLNQWIGSVLCEAVGWLAGRHWVAPALAVPVRAAVLLFKDGREPERGALSAPIRSFTLGLAALARGDHANAIEHLAAAYERGLAFDDRTTTIYRALRGAPSLDEIYMQLLPVAHRSSHIPMARPFIEWVKRLKGDRSAEERWLRDARALVSAA